MRIFLQSYLKGAEDIDINKDMQHNHQCNNQRFHSLIIGKPFYEVSNLEQIRARVGVQRLYTRSEQKVFVKTHAAVGNYYGHQIIDAESTDASVHIIRNPLAVLPSYARHMGQDLDQAVQSMNNPNVMLGGGQGSEEDRGAPITPQGSWSAHTRSWIEASKFLNVHTMRYEDMKDAGLETFGKMLAFIRQPADQERIAKALGASDFDKLKAQDLAKGFKERTKADKGNVFFRSGKVDGWRSELEEKHIIATIQNHWDVMEQLDYIPEDYQDVFENHKYRTLEAMVQKGVNIGIYASDLNDMRAKRGIQSKVRVDEKKTAVGLREKKRKRQPTRPQAKRTFG